MVIAHMLPFLLLLGDKGKEWVLNEQGDSEIGQVWYELSEYLNICSP